MVFSSVLFLFMYLPLVLLIYYLLPRKYRNPFLFVASLIFYGWGEPTFIVLMIFSTISDYTHGYFIDKYRSHPWLPKALLASAMIINLALLGFFKYATFFAEMLKPILPDIALPCGILVLAVGLNYVHRHYIKKFKDRKWLPKVLLASAAGINFALLLGFFSSANFFTGVLGPVSAMATPHIPLPIGISFYTFQTMSYTIDVYRGDSPIQKNIVSFGAYVALFPQLIAGPIVRYKDIAYQLNHRRESVAQFAHGVRIFLIGLAKKVLIANQMGMLWDQLRKTMDVNGILGSWIGIAAFAFQIYFDFSGYSDMACGLGNMIGFEFLKNFNYPYISKSITEFWRRWHISLGTWFREYVYIPLGGNRVGTARLVINLLIVWFLTGLWHGAYWNYVMWGVYFGVLLIIEKLFLLKVLERAPSWTRHLYALFFILMGWVIFYFESTAEMFSYFGYLFTFAKGLIGADALALLINYLPLLLIAGFASTPAARKIYEKFREGKAISYVEFAACAIALVLCTSTLVSQSYNPFLYFRF